MFRLCLSVLIIGGFLSIQASTILAQEANTTQVTPAPQEVAKPAKKTNREISKSCTIDWKAAKAAGATEGQKRREFLKNCFLSKKKEQD